MAARSPSTTARFRHGSNLNIHKLIAGKALCRQRVGRISHAITTKEAKRSKQHDVKLSLNIALLDTLQRSRFATGSAILSTVIAPSIADHPDPGRQLSPEGGQGACGPKEEGQEQQANTAEEEVIMRRPGGRALLHQLCAVLLHRQQQLSPTCSSNACGAR